MLNRVCFSLICLIMLFITVSESSDMPPTPPENAIRDLRGMVHLFCEPYLQVFIDGRDIGKTTKEDSGIIIQDLTIGQHQITIKKKRRTSEFIRFNLNRKMLEIFSERYPIKDNRKNKRSLQVNTTVSIKDVYGAFNYIYDDYTVLYHNRYFIGRESLREQADSFKFIFPDNFINIDSFKINDSTLHDDYLMSSGRIDLFPSVIHSKKPEFKSRIKMTTEIKGLISKEGIVRLGVINNSSGNPAFDTAALLAAYEFRFKPAMNDSVNVECVHTWQIGSILNLDENQNKIIYTFNGMIFTLLSADNFELPDKEFIHQLPDEFYCYVYINKFGVVEAAKISKKQSIVEIDSLIFEAVRSMKFVASNLNNYDYGNWAMLTFCFDYGECKINVEDPSIVFIGVPDEQFPDFKSYIDSTIEIKSLVINGAEVSHSVLSRSSGNDRLDDLILKSSFNHVFDLDNYYYMSEGVWVTYEVKFKE